MYHHDCIRDDAKIPVERGLHWRCNECYDKEKETKEAAMAVDTTAPVAATDSSVAGAAANADAAVGTAATTTTTIPTATAPTATTTTTTAPV